MKKPLLFFLLIVPLVIYAEDDLKPRVGILQFNAKNVSEVEADAVGELFTSELVMTGQFDVVDRNNVESLLTEMDFQMSGCTDSSCAVEIGQILSLEYMVYGSVIKLGEIFAINVQMINVGTAQIVNTGREQFKSIEEAYDVIPKLVAAFVGTFGGGTYVEPVTGEKTRKKVSARKIAGMAVFFSGIGAAGGGGYFFWDADQYNQDYVIPAYEDYTAADYDTYQEYKDEYLTRLENKNGRVTTAMILSGLGGAAILTGALLWFLPAREPALLEEQTDSLSISILPRAAGMYISFRY